MGKYVKVYLNDVQEKGLEAWQAQREEEEGEKTAINALMNEALRNELLERELLEQYTIGNRTGFRIPQ